jgi:hypothetical protein
MAAEATKAPPEVAKPGQAAPLNGDDKPDSPGLGGLGMKGMMALMFFALGMKLLGVMDGPDKGLGLGNMFGKLFGGPDHGAETAPAAVKPAMAPPVPAQPKL